MGVKFPVALTISLASWFVSCCSGIIDFIDELHVIDFPTIFHLPPKIIKHKRSDRLNDCVAKRFTATFQFSSNSVDAITKHSMSSAMHLNKSAFKVRNHLMICQN